MLNNRNDAVKCFEGLQKQIELAKTLNDTNGVCSLLLKWLPGSDIYELIKSQNIPNELFVWKEIAAIQKAKFDKEFHSQVEAERTRLCSDPLDVIKKRVEANLIMDIHLDSYYGKILDLETDNSELAKYKGLLLEFLYRKIPIISPKENKLQVNELIP